MITAARRYLIVLSVGIAGMLAVSTWVGGTIAGGTLVTLEFGGKRLAIPRDYFAFFGSPDPWAPNELFLTAFLPTLAARPTSEQPRGGIDDQMIIEIDARPVTLNIAYATQAQDRDEGPLQERFGLKAFSESPGHGFVNEKTDVFFAHDALEITTLIVCSTGAPYPGCTHKFRWHGFSFEVHYRMTHLKEWATIETRMESFFQGFVIQ